MSWDTEDEEDYEGPEDDEIDEEDPSETIIHDFLVTDGMDIVRVKTCPTCQKKFTCSNICESDKYYERCRCDPCMVTPTDSHYCSTKYYYSKKRWKHE